MQELFKLGPRTDRAPMRFNDSWYAFLDRSGTEWAEKQRLLLADWFAHVSGREAADVRGRLSCGNDEQFEAVVWELFLHEAYRRSGYKVIAHPDLDNSRKHPDWLIEGNGERFYLEAVRSSPPRKTVAQAKLLAEVRETLSYLTTAGVPLIPLVLLTGTTAPSTKELKASLQDWAAKLDPDEVKAAWESGRIRSLSVYPWRREGWLIKFVPLPVAVPEGGVNQRLVSGMMGVSPPHDDAERIARALKTKAAKYGRLDAPLVIAVLSNTESRTEDHDFAEALHGALIGPYTPGRVPAAEKVHRPGFWCSGGGWRNSHAPQVISAQSLYMDGIATAQPRLWSTLEPGAEIPAQPPWLAPVELQERGPVIGEAERPGELFGLNEDWPGQANFSRK